MRRYEVFKDSLQQSRGIGGDFRFADAPGAAPATGNALGALAPAFTSNNAAADDEDDLYN
jgi:transitional endoplasmic reticulum ATPase